MSAVIVGGNECMERRYIELCRRYRRDANGSTKPRGSLKAKLGSPDPIIFFTNTMSRKMLNGALCEIRGSNAKEEYCRSASLSALRSMLEKHAV